MRGNTPIDRVQEIEIIALMETVPKFVIRKLNTLKIACTVHTHEAWS